MNTEKLSNEAENPALNKGDVMPRFNSHCKITGIHRDSCWHCKHGIIEEQFMSIEISPFEETGRLYKNEA